jgi:hypothetical protein
LSFKENVSFPLQFGGRPQLLLAFSPPFAKKQAAFPEQPNLFKECKGDNGFARGRKVERSFNL